MEKETQQGGHVFFYSFLTFFIFNCITTYWVCHATLVGGIIAFMINSILMATVMYLFYKVKNITSERIGYFSLIVIWISMEYIHLNWDLSWPWLTLGNVFADAPYLIQWYEFTGFLGGSFWVLLLNILLFKVYYRERRKKKVIFFFILFLLFPIFASNYMHVNFKNKQQNSLSVVIVQPNIDPYTDKFNISFEKQLDEFIALARTEITDKTQLLIGPETVLQQGIWENRKSINGDAYSIKILRDLQKEYPNLNILVGATTYRLFSSAEEKTSTAREIRNENIFYDAYNSAIFIPDSGKVGVYHKMKLVPGAEKMPFPHILDPLARLAVDFGGTSGSLGKENYNNPFIVAGEVINPLICYESIYGDMKSTNADLIVIITNDGWWKNTAGYKQHFSYASLRAIEQRKVIVRSANTGISGVINEQGEVLQQSEWDESICFSVNANTTNLHTFYAKYGDYIGRLSVLLSFILLITSFVKVRLLRNNN